MTLQDAALKYLAVGLPVFPVSWDHPEQPKGSQGKRKKPLVKWRQYSSKLPTEQEVTQWWTDWPDAGIGLAVGNLTGMMVVDAEHDADMSIFDLLGIETPRVRTGGGGWHFYFKNEPARNIVGQIAPRHDIKCEGGYVLLPPSPHESGGVYVWDIPLGAVTLQPLPEAIRSKIGIVAPPITTRLLNEQSPAGTRNNRAASMSGALLQRFPQPKWEEQAWPLLQAWNQTKVVPPLDAHELRTTFESIAKAEATRQAHAQNGTQIFDPTTYIPNVEQDIESVTIRTAVPDGLAVFQFSEIEQTKGRDLDALLAVELLITGGNPRVFEARLNVLSMSAREGFARALGKTFSKEIAWDLLLAQAASELRKVLANRDTSLWFEDAPPVTNRYLFEPFIVEGAPNVLFGRGGVGKTFVTLRLALALATGSPFLGYTPASRVRTLFVDYEATSGSLADRLALIRGAPELSEVPFDTGMRALRYFSPAGVPLAECIPALKKIIATHEIGLVIIDSAALACGGEPEKAETAVRYFNALAALKTTTLTIAHETKAEDTRYPFGSIFFWNAPRNIWNVQCVREQEDRIIHVSLCHRKANDDRLRSPIPCRVYFGDGFVDMTRDSLQSVPQAELSTRQRVYLLLREGGKQLKEIEETLPEISKKTLTNTLYGDKRFTNADGFWRLVS